MSHRAIVAGIFLLSAAASSPAAVLEDRTIAAWNTYIHHARAERMERIHGHKAFLWIDGIPDGRAEVRNGKILVSPVGSSSKHVPSGLIHDWIGAAFLPNTTLNDTLAVIRDYSRYKDFYQPLIVDSKPLGADGAAQKFSIVIVNKTLFSQTAFYSEWDDTYFQLDSRRWYSVSSSDRVREIENYGEASERELPADQGSGYIWRLYSFSRFEAADGGVYVEREVIALSRDIPLAVRWLADPIVNRLSRNSLTTSLRQTREAVCTNGEAARAINAKRSVTSHELAGAVAGQE